MLITPYNKLIEEAQQIQAFLDTELDQGLVQDNPEIIQERGHKLASIISRTGKMKADAEFHLSTREGIDIVVQVKHLLGQIPTASANVQNAILKTVCREERHLLSQIDRLNATATHQLDWIRSCLSYEKQERMASNYQRA
jgi:hypothetical protein